MEFNPIHLGAFFGLIALAISMIVLNKRYDLKENDMNPVVKRRYV